MESTTNTESVSAKLNDKYDDLFNMFEKNRDKISRAMLWGVNDVQSWMNN